MKSTYKTIWNLMAGQRIRYGAAVVSLVIGSCFMYLVPLVPQITIDGVLSPNTSDASSFVRSVVDFVGGVDFIRSNLWIPALLVFALTGIGGVFTYFRGKLAATASEDITRRLRNRLYRHLQHLPCSYHDGTQTGDQIQRCTSDVETFRRFLSTQVVEIGRAMVMMIIPVPLMVAIDIRMTLVSVVIIPPIVVFSLVFFRKVQSSFKGVDEAEGRLSARIQENLNGIRVVRAFARQGYEIDQFNQRNEVHRNLDNRLYRLFAWYWSLSDFLCMGQNALVVACGGYLLAIGELRIGAFFFFLSVVNMFIWPVRMMGRILSELGKAIVAIGRIDEILSHHTETDMETVIHNRSASHADLGKGAIEFKDVSFAYRDDDYVLKSVSFRIEAGQTMAILGPSGSGKTTIVNLLMRFYDPQKGSISLGGVDITSISRKDVRSKISVVMQEPFLYAKTIRENLSMAAHKPQFSDVQHATEVACIHDSVSEFDDGYDAMAGERGVMLSGGQRQRLTLARSLIAGAPILVLDDAYSAIDTDTERRIRSRLAETKRCTTIVIAHRLATVRDADVILVLSNGSIIQRGTHNQLIEQPGLYRRLWDLQCESETVNESVIQTAAHMT